MNYQRGLNCSMPERDFALRLNRLVIKTRRVKLF